MCLVYHYYYNNNNSSSNNSSNNNIVVVVVVVVVVGTGNNIKMLCFYVLSGSGGAFTDHTLPEFLGIRPANNNKKIYTYIYIYIYTHTYIYIYIYIYTVVYVFVCLCVLFCFMYVFSNAIIISLFRKLRSPAVQAMGTLAAMFHSPRGAQDLTR